MISCLVDLSMANVPPNISYSGIPGDTRLTFDLLHTIEGLEVTGLVYDPGDATIAHRFPPSTATMGERLASQAEFLNSIAFHSAIQPTSALGRRLSMLRRGYRLLLSRRVQTMLLETDFLSGVIWRTLLAKTLSVEESRDRLKEARFLLANLSGASMARRAALGLPQPRLRTKPYDFIIHQDSRPVKVSKNTAKIIRYHDLIPITCPDVVDATYTRWHHNSIMGCQDAYYFCNSEPTRQELVSAYPALERQSITIPYFISSNFYRDERRELVPDILDRRKVVPPGLDRRFRRLPERSAPYLLAVGTLEPRKNYVRLLEAFGSMMTQREPRLRLVLVANYGWQYQPILEALEPLLARGDVIHLQQVASDELRVLYSCAAAFVACSHKEGFGLPPVEAAKCGALVVASDIQAHRWVLGDCPVYCNPSSIGSIRDALLRATDPDMADELRDRQQDCMKERLELFEKERVKELWNKSLTSISTRGVIG